MGLASHSHSTASTTAEIAQSSQPNLKGATTPCSGDEEGAFAPHSGTSRTPAIAPACAGSMRS